ncbi:hypothetical protein [Bacillus sp. AFS017336]|uniref:hypothetical protein n=1 Tax=Bacillus sp. AFS017336 TaxID=2033489 RepID=UPI000BF244B9|nr:hypothetical protein [Bacillus sp. AFS017336]PEK98189.1 hypothetical protein CN601_26120 [Bacillus sp. AFS017336]
MAKIIGIIFTLILVLSLINGIVTHNDATSMPFGAFLMDVFILLLLIFFIILSLFKRYKKGLKVNYFWMGYFSVLAVYLVNDIIHYLLK